MSIELDGRVTLGALSLEVALAAEDGQTVGIVGPNGAGKTTLLRVLAGLVPLDAGRLVIDDVVVDDPAARVFVPPERRAVGMVFQDYLLFPHLSVVSNVAFGLRSRGCSRAESRAIALDWLSRVGLEEHADLRPAALSGGQAQRVALARALAAGPRLLLLDEPLAAVDAATRVALRRELGEHLRSFAGVAVLVTHDPQDAAALTHRVVALDAGRIVGRDQHRAGHVDSGGDRGGRGPVGRARRRAREDLPACGLP